MTALRNKIVLLLAFFAAAVFLAISTGGEFLHDHLHHHTTQEEHNDCPVYQLALQFTLVTPIFALALALLPKQQIVSLRRIFLFRICCAFPALRAPPLV